MASDFKAEPDVRESNVGTALLTHHQQCVVAIVDADAAHNKDLAAKYDVTSFPTIKFFSKDNKEPIPYTGGRARADFVSFLNEHCGTSRAIGGTLNNEV